VRDEKKRRNKDVSLILLQTKQMGGSSCNGCVSEIAVWKHVDCMLARRRADALSNSCHSRARLEKIESRSRRVSEFGFRVSFHSSLNSVWSELCRFKLDFANRLLCASCSIL
jgi:hypothetical protein